MLKAGVIKGGYNALDFTKRNVILEYLKDSCSARTSRWIYE